MNPEHDQNLNSHDLLKSHSTLETEKNQDYIHMPDISPRESLDEEFNGIDIKVYAKQHQLSVNDVWRKIHTGKLLARSEKGKLLIYKETLQNGPKFQLHEKVQIDTGLRKSEKKLKPNLSRDHKISTQLKNNAKNLETEELPAIPSTQITSSMVKSSTDLEPVTNSLARTPEMALLLDHLSLAKEENKELLQLTRESIANVTKMSERIVSLKDEVIESKNIQIQAYKSKLAEQEKLIKLLSQKNEDLEMLTKSMNDLD